MKKDDNELKQMSDKIKVEHMEHIGNMISTISNELKETTVQNATVPEIIFKEYFLPMFIRFATKKLDKNQDDNLLRKWIELAGGPYSEVDVIDSKGNKVYTVPSVYNRNVVNLSSLNGVNFAEMGIRQKQYTDLSPQQGENYAIDMVKSLPKFINSAKTQAEEQNRWVEILTRYKDEKSNDIFSKKPSKSKQNDLGLDFSEDE